jgi:hypothetical protein
LETQVNNPSEFLEMLECVAFENMKHGESWTHTSLCLSSWLLH